MGAIGWFIFSMYKMLFSNDAQFVEDRERIGLSIKRGEDRAEKIGRNIVLGNYSVPNPRKGLYNWLLAFCYKAGRLLSRSPILFITLALLFVAYCIEQVYTGAIYHSFLGLFLFVGGIVCCWKLLFMKG